MTFMGSDIASTIDAFAREDGITHLVVGRSRRAWYRRWFGPSVLDKLLHVVPDVDVLVVGRSTGG